MDKAYKAFFSRVKAGKTAGFPRYKSYDRFSGWVYKTYGDGWKCHCGFSISRDVNSALVILKFALGSLKIDEKIDTRCRLCVQERCQAF
ncbi:hypothetical protein [Fluviispira sanaruensis]|uniref:Transposase n=1 Tax=Fluviispira sanaruensis TaxID=2493639 RepID=A0A4P2VTE5_FLUSA|nr:hypothetical protein [Fluviispira sanaruensis]BBH52645.1 hypothetical protein JCM31447_10860 [Fluviispira sanaruensis]